MGEAGFHSREAFEKIRDIANVLERKVMGSISWNRSQDEGFWDSFYDMLLKAQRQVTDELALLTKPVDDDESQVQYADVPQAAVEVPKGVSVGQYGDVLQPQPLKQQEITLRLEVYVNGERVKHVSPGEYLELDSWGESQ